MVGVEPYPRPAADAGQATRTAFLVLDTESVPDGDLIAQVKYAGDGLTGDEAIERARAEARDKAWNGSDFLPVSFQIPVAVCVIRVGPDFALQKLTCLDAPLYRPREIVKKFWLGLGAFKAKLVSFNGRGFDMPLLELAAFRYGFSAREYYLSRNRYNSSSHVDLLDWLTNFGAYRLTGGLNLLAKMLGKPGKMEVAGDQVLEMYRAGQFQQINDYCLFDTLDTYFVFLRTRVLTGDVSIERELELVNEAREFLAERVAEHAALERYLANWVE